MIRPHNNELWEVEIDEPNKITKKSESTNSNFGRKNPKTFVEKRSWEQQ